MNGLLNPERLVRIIQKLFPNVDGDTIVAWVRTIVPAFIGGLLVQLAAALPAVTTWLDSIYSGWQVGVGVLATTIVTGLYYALARKIESKYPNAGKYLLGSAAKPVYVAPEHIAADDSIDTNLDI